MNTPIAMLLVRQAADVVTARQRARQVAELLGLAQSQQAQVATAVSEVARNALQHAGGGQVSFEYCTECQPPELAVRVSDRGPGIANVEQALAGGNGHSGMGLVSAQRLADAFTIESVPGQGTTIELRFALSDGAQPSELREVARRAAAQQQLRHDDLLGELHHQNRELAQAMEELRQAQVELADLNRELENTNRGVVALYAELDERAEQLRRADEVKTRFFSHMSHEFRTPVNSILALSQLLLDRVDGELTAEQARQVSFIRKAANDLSELVNDLLDLAKVEAGQITLRLSDFEVGTLFGTLRGMFRPLATNPAVSLIFEEPLGLPSLYCDESKVAQILRNFISNALKFTERGEVRVFARLVSGEQAVVFSVADTGIGIAPEDQERIFYEFGQVESHIQSRVKGTGLGLSLSRRLADLLQGRILLQSEVGRGSTFSLYLPLAYAAISLETEPAAALSEPAVAAPADPAVTILAIDDDEISRYLLRGLLAGQPHRLVEASNGEDGLRQAAQLQPDVIVLDLAMPGMSGFEVLERLRADPATRALPVIVFTSSVLDEADRRRLEPEVIDIISKEVVSREATQGQLQRALAQAQAQRSV